MSSRAALETDTKNATAALVAAVQLAREKEMLLNEHDCCDAIGTTISSTTKQANESDLDYGKRVCAALMAAGYKVVKN